MITSCPLELKMKLDIKLILMFYCGKEQIKWLWWIFKNRFILLKGNLRVDSEFLSPLRVYVRVREINWIPSIPRNLTEV